MKNWREVIDMDNIILMTDSYKVTHWPQYPPKTTYNKAYLESRGGRFLSTMFYELQYILKRYMTGPVVTHKRIDEAKKIFKEHFFGNGDLFNETAWRNIVEKHGGNLPVLIKAVPEGMVVPVGNALMTIENTDPEYYWLPNYLETLLVEVWNGCTVGTLSREIKKIILSYLKKTGTPELIDFKLHDFGYRGVSSPESAAIGGSAHLVNFKGTDTLAAIVLAKAFYGATEMPGYSIPAAEHSTITTWGKDREVDAYRNMLTTFPTGYVAVVSDSYDIYTACEKIWGEELRDLVVNRNGTLVIRPDSGIPEVATIKILNILEKKFGRIINDKGYKVLPEYLRLIWGDGVDLKAIDTILETMEMNGWSADNIAFGMGGALLQKLNRDTQKFAFKSCYAIVDGKPVEVSKSPIDASWKSSKAGDLTLAKMITEEGEVYKTVKMSEIDHTHIKEVLVPVFKNGELLKEYTFDEVRKNAEIIDGE